MIRRNGRKSVVGPGENPTVTDNEGGQWAVSFENGGRVVVRVLKGSGGQRALGLTETTRRTWTSRSTVVDGERI